MTPALSDAALLDALRWRYAVKKFDPARKIAPALWAALEESLRLSPSSFGLQPWRFIVVDNPALRATLRPHAWGQSQITDASHLVVLAARKGIGEPEIDAHIARVAKARKTTVEGLKGYRDVMTGLLVKGPVAPRIDDWAARQVYLALGVLLTAAAAIGVDACPIEGFVPAEVDKALGLDKRGLASVLLCTLGYRAPDDRYAQAPKLRYDLSEVVEHV